MKVKVALTTAVLLAGMLSTAGGASERQLPNHRASLRTETHMPSGFVPAVARQAKGLDRWFVVMKAPSVADRVIAAKGTGTPLSPDAQRSAYADARSSQDAAVRDAQARGGLVVFRYGKLVNAFSVRLNTAGAQALAARPDVSSVQPVGIVKMLSNESTKFIGAPKVWKAGYLGDGMRVAMVDTGIDYTHKDFGGPGTVEAYDTNDQSIIEPGTFPTTKVIGGTTSPAATTASLTTTPRTTSRSPTPTRSTRTGTGPTPAARSPVSASQA